MLVAPAIAQNTTYGFGDLGGVSTFGSPTVNWAPTVALADLLNNNTANCFVNCSPLIFGSTTGTNYTNFVGESEARFVATATRSGGVLTVTPALGQGCCSAGNNDGAYSFNTTDSMILESCGSLNGTYPIAAVLHGTVSSKGGNMTATLAGTTLTVSNCTVRRSNSASDDQFIAPSNSANYTIDGVSLNDYMYGPGNGNSVPIFLHYEPWFHCATAPTTPCAYGAKPTQTTFQGHIANGYVSINTNVIKAQHAQIASLVPPSVQIGMDVDWGGPPLAVDTPAKTDEKSVMNLWAQELAGQTHVLFFATQDNSGFKCPAVSGTVYYTPTCVESIIYNTFLYMKTANGVNYTSPFDGSTQVGSGMFSNTAYFHEPSSGRPVFATFINGTVLSCPGGYPCNNYSSGTCSSSSDCWTQLYNDLASLTATWPASQRPLIFSRNTFTGWANNSMNGGAYLWMQVSGDAKNQSFNDSLIKTASTSSLKFINGAIDRVNHGQDSFADDFNIVGSRCAQTFEDWMQRSWKLGYFGPSPLNKFPIAMQIPTASDYEEGTAVEPGIPSCYSISATINSGVVSWTLATSNNKYAPVPTNTSTAQGTNCYNVDLTSPYVPCNDTLDHVALIAKKTGGAVGANDSMILDTFPLAAGGYSGGTFTMSNYAMDSGTYTLYVKLVPKALIHTSVSSPLTFVK